MTFSITYRVYCKFCDRTLELNHENFYWSNSAGLYLRPCRKCISARAKRNYPKLREKQIAHILERYRNEPDFKKKVIERYKKWAKDNPERFRQQCKKNQARYTDELRNHYVAHTYRKRYHEEPTHELVEIVRMQLKLKRAIKDAKRKN